MAGCLEQIFRGQIRNRQGRLFELGLFIVPSDKEPRGGSDKRSNEVYSGAPDKVDDQVPN